MIVPITPKEYLLSDYVVFLVDAGKANSVVSTIAEGDEEYTADKGIINCQEHDERVESANTPFFAQLFYLLEEKLLCSEIYIKESRN